METDILEVEILEVWGGMGYHVRDCHVVHRKLRRLSSGESFGTPALFEFKTRVSLLFPRCFGHLGVLIRTVRGRLDLCALAPMEMSVIKYPNEPCIVTISAILRETDELRLFFDTALVIKNG